MIEAFLGLALAAGALTLGPSEGHPMSRSSSRVDLEEGVVRWTLRVQAESVWEVLPLLDTNADGELSRGEADAGAEEIAAYLGEHFGVRGTEPLDAPEWAGELIYMGAPRRTNLAGESGWIEAAWEVRVEDEIEALGVRMELFEVTSPDHVDVFELRRRGRLAYTGLFSAAAPGAWIPYVEVDGVGFASWVGWGIGHILTGYDHLAFLLALLMCVRGARQMAWVVTAFTVAHSVTLALAALEVVSLSDRFVELVIALSISFVAWGGYAKEPRRGLWLEAAVFGLIHGLGFAGFLGEALMGEERRLGALLGFNVGVELGQLLFLAPLALGLAWWGRGREVRGGWWVPAVPRKVVSACVLLAGLFWFLQRAGWVG